MGYDPGEPWGLVIAAFLKMLLLKGAFQKEEVKAKAVFSDTVLLFSPQSPDDRRVSAHTQVGKTFAPHCV